MKNFQILYSKDGEVFNLDAHLLADFVIYNDRAMLFSFTFEDTQHFRVMTRRSISWDFTDQQSAQSAFADIVVTFMNSILR